jgi:hypothetical protein
MLVAWLFIGMGTLAILNTALKGLEVYGLIKSYITIYFFPVILVLAGVYLLFRNNRRY